MNGKKKFCILLVGIQILMIAVAISCARIMNVVAQAQTTAEATAFDYYDSSTAAFLGLSAAIAIGMAAIAAAWVLRTVGTAAISAMTEREEAFGKLIVIVALGEAIAIYGLIVALLIVFKIPSPPV